VNLEFAYLRDRQDAIPEICKWYLAEWSMPEERTRKILSKRLGTDVPFQTVCLLDGRPVGTAGLYESVGICRAEARFRVLRPWLALFYTQAEFRGRGIGAWMCTRMDAEALRLGLDRYYLYTLTAESLYRRLGWTEMERVHYRGKEAVVMFKDLTANHRPTAEGP
jgi:GNAT superfamily N-acetyltransferase